MALFAMQFIEYELLSISAALAVFASSAPPAANTLCLFLLLLLCRLQVRPGGIVIWRSASLSPPYARLIAEAGFEVRCLQRATDGYMDRVNMYSSFFMAIRKQKCE